MKKQLIIAGIATVLGALSAVAMASPLLSGVPLNVYLWTGKGTTDFTTYTATITPGTGSNMVGLLGKVSNVSLGTQPNNEFSGSFKVIAPGSTPLAGSVNLNFNISIGTDTFTLTYPIQVDANGNFEAIPQGQVYSPDQNAMCEFELDAATAGISSIVKSTSPAIAKMNCID